MTSSSASSTSTRRRGDHAEGQPVRPRLRRVNGFRRKEVEKLARRSLDPTSTVISDGLGCFRGIADAGCTHQPIRTGSDRKAVLTPAFRWVDTALGNIKTALTATYRAIRQKHVPRYLAEFAYRFNRRYDRRHDAPASAARTPPMPYASSNWAEPMPYALLKLGKKLLAIFRLNGKGKSC